MIVAHENRMLDAALECAARDWPVFPIHAIEDGRCSCGGSRGCKPGKHPRTPHGFKDATTDPATIRKWLTKWPAANIGIPTGKRSGWVVLDVDPQHGGDESLRALTDRHGPLPHTVEAITGGGGRHVVFAVPEVHVRCRIGFRPGLDFKGEGGYIVVAPSLHLSGRRYEWELSHLPEETPLAPMPTWLLEIVREPEDARDGQGTERTETTERTESYDASPHNDSVSQLPSVSSVDSVFSVLSVSPETAQQIIDAVEATAPNGLGQRNNAVFVFARHLKGIAEFADAPASILRPIVSLWHKRAFPKIGTKPLEDTWADFIRGWPTVKFPKGKDAMAIMLKRADAARTPECAAHYESQDTVRLVKLCRELQRAAGDAPFFLACRTAGEVLGIGHVVAWKRLAVLIDDGIIRIEEPGTKTRAARFRYLKSLENN